MSQEKAPIVFCKKKIEKKSWWGFLLYKNNRKNLIERSSQNGNPMKPKHKHLVGISFTAKESDALFKKSKPRGPKMPREHTWRYKLGKTKLEETPNWNRKETNFIFKVRKSRCIYRDQIILLLQKQQQTPTLCSKNTNTWWASHPPKKNQTLRSRKPVP